MKTVFRAGGNMLFLFIFTLLQIEAFDLDDRHYVMFTSSDKDVVFSSYRLSNPDRIVLEINGSADSTVSIESNIIKELSVSKTGNTSRFVFTVKENVQYTVLNRKNALLIGFSEKLFVEDSNFDSVYALLQNSKAEKLALAQKQEAELKEKLALELKKKQELELAQKAEKEKKTVAENSNKDESELVSELVKDLDTDKEKARIAKLEKEKTEKEAAEKERIALLEKEKSEKEAAEKERVALLEKEKAEKEAAEKERMALLEKEKAEKEAAEKERIAKLENELKTRQELEKKELAQKAEAERIAKLENELKARQELEKKELAQKAEAERIAKLENELKARQELEKMELAQKAEKERLAKLETEKVSQPELKKSVKTEEGEIIHLKVTKAEPEKKLSETLPELPVKKLEKKGVLKNIYFRKFAEFSRVTMELTGETDYQFREIKGGYVIDVHNFEKIPKYLLNIIDTRAFEAEVQYIYPKKAGDILKIYIKTDPGMAVRKSGEGNLVNFDFYKPTIQ